MKKIRIIFIAWVAFIAIEYFIYFMFSHIQGYAFGMYAKSIDLKEDGLDNYLSNIETVSSVLYYVASLIAFAGVIYVLIGKVSKTHNKALQSDA